MNTDEGDFKWILSDRSEEKGIIHYLFPFLNFQFILGPDIFHIFVNYNVIYFIPMGGISEAFPLRVHLIL